MEPSVFSAIGTFVRSFFPTRRCLGYWALTFLAFLLSAKLGQFMYLRLDTTPALLWPPTGIGLAAIFLGGRRMASAVACAAFVAMASYGLPLPIALASTFGNTVQALIGGFLFRSLKFRPNIGRLRDTLYLITIALTVTMIVPTVSMLSRILFGLPWIDPLHTWLTVWTGGILSVLLVTPLITGYAQDFRIDRDRFPEHGIVIAVAIAIAYVLFWLGMTRFAGIPMVYALLLPFFWIAIRFPPRSTALALFLTTIVAVSGVMYLPSNTSPLGEAFFQTELLFGVFAFIFLIVSSAIEDRRTAVSDLRAYVDQLEHVLTKLRQEDAAKSDFLAILSHELRNPLAPVLSTLEYVRVKRNPEDEEAVILAGAEQRLRMMGRLLDDLLDISRVQEKRLKLKKEYVNLRAIVQRSIEDAHPMIQKFRHTLDVSLPEESITLFADPIRIEQVIVNVLNNAAKYTPEGGKIEFAATRRGDRAVLTIRDNGTGIEASMLGRIFEPFLQVSNTKYGTSGVGVGLALAKELVELHDGSIIALSAGLGRGSTFVIEFPIVESPVAPSSATQPAASRTMRPLNILIVDDNQAGAEALGRLLSFRGHATHLAFSGLEGVERGIAMKPDAILLDIGLPDIGGYEVASRLRKSGVEAFIVALTGYGQDEDRRKALESGCDGHLTKPVGLQDIERALLSRFAS